MCCLLQDYVWGLSIVCDAEGKFCAATGMRNIHSVD